MEKGISGNKYIDEVKLESGTETSLLFVYQSDWQRRLLSRYDNELVFLDATYRTTRYALSLFFFVVKTDIDYQIAATLVTENEKRRKYCGSFGDYQKLESRITSALWDGRLLYRRDKCHGKSLPRYGKYSFLTKCVKHC